MRICAWCKKVLGSARTAPQGTATATSHGICPSCLAAQLASTTRRAA